MGRSCFEVFKRYEGKQNIWVKFSWQTEHERIIEYGDQIFEKNMIILAIDTSCDDTSAAVVKDKIVLSNVISSQTELHNTWGGVVPIIIKASAPGN